MAAGYILNAPKNNRQFKGAGFPLASGPVEASTALICPDIVGRRLP